MNISLSTSKTIFFLLFFISTTAIFHSCVKEEEHSIYPTYVPFDGKETITTTITGLVVDENNLPINGSEVYLKVGNTFEVTTTNQRGRFSYINVEVAREGAFLKVHQMGKFEAFRKMNVIENGYSYTKIKLLDKNIVGFISAIDGGTINHSSNAQIDLPANGVRYESGSDYTGNIEVAMSWIDPTTEDLTSRMVGDLSGIDKEGKKVVLGTFGMLNVELLNDNGEQLQLKEGKSAMLSFPVPAEIRSQAPSIIPLWYYDEESETWIEEGVATLQGGFYVGEVGHFSSWNVDTKGESIVVKGKVVTNINEEEVIKPYLQIFVSVDGVQRAGGFLDDTGAFEFYNFPANTAFTLTFLDGCDNVLSEKNYNPLTNDTDLGTIVIKDVELHNLIIKGIGRSCNGDLLSEAYIQVTLDGQLQNYSLEEDGTFEFNTTLCRDKSAVIELIDITNKKLNHQTISVNIENDLIDMGILTTCENVDFYFHLKINDKDSLFLANPEVSFISPNMPWSDQSLYVGAFNQATFGRNISIQITIPNMEDIGIYENALLYWIIPPEIEEPNFHTPNDFHIPNQLTVEVSQYGESIGDIVEGAFTGEGIKNSYEFVLDETAVISGSFKAIRK